MGNQPMKPEGDLTYQQQLKRLEERAAMVEERMNQMIGGESTILRERRKLKEERERLAKENRQLVQKQESLEENQRQLQKEFNNLMTVLQHKQDELARLRKCMMYQGIYTSPTDEEYRLALQKTGYVPGCLHVAIAGFAGVGKSSLLNSIRGLRKGDRGAAATGYNETTIEIGRYPAPDNDKVFYYDVPGAGTVKISSWDYFKQQGLYLMQAIVIVWCDRIMQIDVDIMACCIIANIPFFLVRSKCDQQMSNFREDIADALGLDPADMKNPRLIDALTDKVAKFHVDTCEAAREMIGAAYRKAEREVPDDYPYEERVFLVNNRSLYTWMTKRYEDANALDERYLCCRICREIADHTEPIRALTRASTSRTSGRSVYVKS